MNLEQIKTNAEENYINTPLSVLKYISTLEKQIKDLSYNQPHKRFTDEWGNSDWRDTGEMGG